ncbi:hypothetical protein AHAS_Ahas01G0137000 [Arachis hypogaea]
MLFLLKLRSSCGTMLTPSFSSQTVEKNMVKNRPPQVPKSGFIKLIYYWSHPLIQVKDYICRIFM